MEPLRGTDISLDIALIEIKAAEEKNKLDFARAKLVLDAQKTAGQELVKMLEKLGTVIDTYI
jgi:hypothetical protein